MNNIKVLGAGFGCVDVIPEDDAYSFCVGGTAANVLTILANMGLKVFFLTAEYSSDLGNYYIRAMIERNIHPIFFQKTKKAPPIVLEELDVKGKHYFVTFCPHCGKSLVKPILPSDHKINSLFDHSESMTAIFYDRCSPGIRLVAEQNTNGWNMYEPNSCRMFEIFAKGCESADIVKFSADRIPGSIAEDLQAHLIHARTQLVIVTKGRRGLSFSCKRNGDWTDWRFLPGVDYDHIVDSAGAGDWVTAGFLYKLLEEYPSVGEISEDKITEMLEFGQKLAAMACSYKGAQGILKDMGGITQLRKATDLGFSLIVDNEMSIEVCCEGCGAKLLSE